VNWPGPVLGAVAVALVELDAAHAGQFQVSRPIVLGPLLGLALGHADLGAGVGILLELMSLSELPVGGHLPLNATVASGAALLLAGAPCPVPVELALPVGLALGWLHQRLEGLRRLRRNGLGRSVEALLRLGREPGLGSLAAAELCRQALTTLGLLAAALAALPLLRWGWSIAPEALKAGLRLSWGLSPWLAAASLLRAAGNPWRVSV